VVRPRLKPVFPPTPLGAGRIAIGGIDAGLAAELEDDEHGHVWRLLSLLDGTRDLDGLAEEMQRAGAPVPRGDVDAAVATLAEAGYLEDAAASPPAGVFGAPELERYRRNADFLSFFSPPELSAYELQARLRRSSVAVVGLGGLGASAAAGLASAGVGTLRVVDFDTVELSNLNRQVLYTEADLGVPKAQAAAARLRRINPNVDVEAVDLRIAGASDARAVVAGFDFLVCAADRPRILIHEWLNSAAAAEDVPWAWGANAGLTVQMGLLHPGRTGCFECQDRFNRANHPSYEEARRWEIEVLGEVDVNPCIAPVSMMLGGMLALDVVYFLSRATPPASYGTTTSVDLRTFESRSRAVPRRDDCTTCTAAAARRPEVAR
jgi:bacteriocin biosynthesis cyclodehydratase domain-containing protein